MTLNAKLIGCVSDDGALLGESPVWDERDGYVYWLDIKGRKIFCYSPEDRSTRSTQTQVELSAIAPNAGGGFIAAGASGFSNVQISGETAVVSPIIDPEADLPSNRFNDGKLDRTGGFWAGTMDDAEQDVTGSWWRLAQDGSVSKLAGGFKVTNGPAFDLEGGRVFLTDSARQIVFVAETDGVSLGATKPFLQFARGDGFPDGMEVDCERCLWIAFWDGACVRRFSPQGELLLQIDLPVPRPTSLAFAPGGLYVTSASIGLDTNSMGAAPQSGGLFFLSTKKDLRRS
ncbi:SMP-30/gluconolactonase/LRE family protein [uncultured Erythrobacter sp.]|uniref:SMP-30/gluconolactonase/LRE family protein n=1 Tax=uncultured Erythrobacter sp. TaxID=263913 RepID=UPI00263611AD|nr:SMP-30/gluconolactonase/LRE family protein [uncultured Erythrobacter sp.]